MSKIIDLLKENHAEIMEWARSLTNEQMLALWDFGGWTNGVIKNPAMASYESMPERVKEVFSRPEIRQVSHVTMKPYGCIPPHTHKNKSHYWLTDEKAIKFAPYDGNFYLVTHFAIAVPANSENVYMSIGGRKYHWQVGKFDVFDVVNNQHHVVHDVPDSLRFLYIEFYPADDDVGRGAFGPEIDIPAFYGTDSIVDWKSVIGEELHCHFGHFYTDSDDYEMALKETVRLFYRFIPDEASILDLGCGWAGPARMLEKERGCRVSCVSNTPAQAEYIRTILGKTDVRIMDLEQGFEGEGEWDIAWMMESLEHIWNKEKLIASLRSKVKTLLIRTNLDAMYHEGEEGFARSLFMISPPALVDILRRNGWKIEHAIDTRRASWQTFMHWKVNLHKRFSRDIPDGYFKALDTLCNIALAGNKEAWIRRNPLLNIVARRID